MKSFDLHSCLTLSFFVFQFIFDNYTKTGPSTASPATSQSLKPPERGVPTTSSTPDPLQKEVEELRQQLRSLKKNH
jgi:hypothetical protein